MKDIYLEGWFIMGKFIIEGNRPLIGKINISGSKNSALPILSASILCKDKCVIKNCPNIRDVQNTISILREIGADVSFKGNTLTIDSSDIYMPIITNTPADKIRSSITFLSSLIGVFGEAIVSNPGGCNIGSRPIDLHLEALSKMNVNISLHENTIHANTQNLSGTEISLKFPSVGATENIMIASVLAKGKTIINNPAKEPEIIDLQNFLNSMGAKISGAGTSKIISEGVSSLHGTEYKIIPDRIEAGTFLIAAAATKGELFLKNAIADHVSCLFPILEDCGALILYDNSGIYIDAKNISLCPRLIKTDVYPAFPTDLQPQIMSLLTMAQGTSIIIETVFESRFSHGLELTKMGADIDICDNRFIIKGVPHLHGNTLSASDLRCGAALIIAALSAKGKSTIYNSEYVERGYENIQKKLKSAGAFIQLKD